LAEILYSLNLRNGWLRNGLRNKEKVEDMVGTWAIPT
jgi:hypothetical protein